MIDKVKDACTGCSACHIKCPVDAIHMSPDMEGFLRPEIDMAVCIQCQLCEKVCSVLPSHKGRETQPPEVFAAWTRDNELRIQSTSGGIFSELARQILNQRGWVAGARYYPDHSVGHTCINTEENLPILRQSKYLQSALGQTLHEVKALADTGVQVLFCGTPCQAAGLHALLGKEYSNVIICDFICRGVTSPMVYQMYLSDLEKEFGAPVEMIQFKNKNIGWNQFCTFIRFQNGKTYQKDRYQDAYMFGYLKSNLYIRPCCYECKFKDIKRVADISLGDFWGIGNTRPHLDQNKGTSLVLLNTEKGRALFASVKDRLVWESCTYEESLAGNLALRQSPLRPRNRQAFFALLQSTGSFHAVMRWYEKKPLWILCFGRLLSFEKKMLKPLRVLSRWLTNYLIVS